MDDKPPHSSAYLTDIRDFWWNPDFIELMAKRWQLHQVKSILDVGCGIGHWGQMLVPHLRPDATLTGIDREPEWIAKATSRAEKKGLSSHAKYLLGQVEKIPFPDNYFDMVTCQTVLIHVKDVNLAIKEMTRVLKPGGLLAVAEPNNISSGLIFDNLHFHDPIDEVLDSIRFELICERGKEALNEGNNSCGDIMPSFFYKNGLGNINVYMNDLANFFVPPYESPREVNSIKEFTEHSEDFWNLIKTDTKRHFFAGGGTELEFDKHWLRAMKDKDQLLKSYQNQKICYSGGIILYLISGRKPDAKT